MHEHTNIPNLANNSTAEEANVSLTINAKAVTAPNKLSVIQALWHAGHSQVLGVGCLDGVCGSCSVMVRRIGEPELSMELGCQLLVEEGMAVFFSSFETPTQHHYDLSQINNPLVVHNEFLRIFPEAKNCRYCGGCNRACPKNIDVEQSVALAVKGNFKEASELFVDCVMCNLCVSSCPENIEPNHVGLFARRVTSHFNTRPANLTHQIQAIRSGELSVDIDAMDDSQ